MGPISIYHASPFLANTTAVMNHDGHNNTMAPRCKMNMLWNTDIKDTCIIFRSWHVTSNSYFLWSCIAIAALAVLYEYLRLIQRKLDMHIGLSLTGNVTARGRDRSRGSGVSIPRNASASPECNQNHEESGLLSGRRLRATSLSRVPVPTLFRFLRAATYGATVFLSFFLMLVFMTYNAYLIAAVIAGATLGHYIFGCTLNADAILAESSSGKGLACH